MPNNRDERERALLEATPAEQKVSRLLMCDLTPDEQRERGLALANLAQEIEGLQAEQKRVMGEYKTRILEAQTRHAATKQAVLTRREHREVTCTEHYDYKKGLVYVVRDDLGLITENRPMTATERQRPLPNVKTNQGDKQNEHKDEPTTTATRGKASRAAANAGAPA